jgi:hypothetical protein
VQPSQDDYKLEKSGGESNLPQIKEGEKFNLITSYKQD